ncbi:response regulator transcription factor [Runella salmonicolor]|uniref:Response regulator transcription factor n=1 Tax=Runella salmonicolor TaxID=2950278 RepID=A0ABT1FV33_9BACT|nr:response regulator transcription factor [Runella salmonicolor]MCP1385632.1 response regulator transcription factor [Runella salmonicolor]
MPRILYVEDDPNLGFVTKDNLELHHYDIVHCTDGLQALETFQKQQPFDLCVLDVMLPHLDGFTLAQKIRQQDMHVPILFLTARSLQEDKLHGLRLGADDYLTKPFSMEELVLKIAVFLRRSQKNQSSESTTQTPGVTNVGNYAFDFEKLYLQIDGKTQDLTFREAEVLRYLAERPNQVIKREDLLKAIWGDDDYFMGRSLDVFMSRLRKYLCDDPNIKIEGIHGVGFRMRW